MERFPLQRRVRLLVTVLVTAPALAGCLAPPAPASSTEALQATAWTCLDPCVFPIDVTPSRAWEASAAVDPRDANHIVVGHAVWARDALTGMRTSWLVSQVTFDGGRSWETVRLPGGPDAGLDHPLAAATAMGDALVQVLPDGTVLFSGLAFNHAGTGARDAGAFARRAYDLFVARSTDGGRTYPEVSIVREGRGALAIAVSPAFEAGAGRGGLWDANDKQWMTVGPDGTILLAWSEIQIVNPPEEPVYRTDVLASLSRDGGKTWRAPVRVERGGDYLGASPAIQSDGTYHVAYVELTTFDLRIATSKDGGETWTARSVGQSAYFPSLAVQGLPDGEERLLMAYAQKLEDARHALEQDRRKQRPALIASDDGGETWGAPRFLDDAPEAPGRTMPMVIVDGAGVAHATYFRATAEGAHLYARTLAPDGTLGAPIKLDEMAAPASQLGDYIGLAPRPGGAFLAWVTTKDGQEFDVVAANVGRIDRA